MPDNLLRYDEQGAAIGLNIQAVKNFVAKTTPFHSDLIPYILVHYRARAAYLEELSKQTTPWQIVVWTSDVIKALAYLEKVVDAILEADETTYSCDLRNHRQGEICPNRRNLTLPDPEE